MINENDYRETAKFFINNSKDINELCEEILVSLYKLDSRLFNTDKELKISSEKMSSILDKVNDEK